MRRGRRAKSGWKRAALAVASLAFGAGCGGGLPSPAVVEKLRLLAMTTDTPDVRAGATESVRAVWADGRSSDSGAPRTVYFTWRLCALGGDSDNRICLRRDRGVDLRTATAADGGDTITITADDRRNADPTLSGTDAEPSDGEYVLLLAMCPESPAVFDPGLNLYNCPSEANVENENREGIMAVRRLGVRPAETPDAELNHNPVMARYGLAPYAASDAGAAGDAGVPIVSACPPGSTAAETCLGVHLFAVAGEGSVETRSDGLRESLLASFFVSAGSMDRPRAVANGDFPADGGAQQGIGLDNSMNATWFPPETPGPATVWISLRDGRGGEVIQSFGVTVR